MGRKAEVSWQVLQNDEDWSDDANHPLPEQGPFARQGNGSGLASGLRWCTLTMAVLLLLILAWWMTAQDRNILTAADGDIEESVTANHPVFLQQWAGDYFLITYPATDAEAAIDAARLLEARYGQLRRALGLAQVEDETQIPIYWERSALDDQEATVCSALGTVRDALVAQALPSTGEVGSWQAAPAFVQGLRDWAELLHCPLSQGEYRPQLQAQFISAAGLPRLQELVPALYNYPYRGESPGKTAQDRLAFAALIEYATQTYGVGRLPLLLSELQQPVTWGQLVSAVFGVPAEEFEAGWREWLVEKYGL